MHGQNHIKFECQRIDVENNRMNHGSSIFFTKSVISSPIQITALSKALICTHRIAGIAGSNPTDDMDVRLFLCVLCCLVEVPATG